MLVSAEKLLSWFDFLSNWAFLAFVYQYRTRQVGGIGLGLNSDGFESFLPATTRLPSSSSVGLFVLIPLLLIARGWLYWFVALGTQWTPVIHLGVAKLFAISAQRQAMVAYSFASFFLLLFLSFCWAIGLVQLVNRPQTWNKLWIKVRVYLGLIGRLPRPLPMLLLMVAAGSCWYLYRIGGVCLGLQVLLEPDPVPSRIAALEAVGCAALTAVHCLAVGPICMLFYGIEKAAGPCDGTLFELASIVGRRHEKLLEKLPGKLEAVDLRGLVAGLVWALLLVAIWVGVLCAINEVHREASLR